MPHTFLKLQLNSCPNVEGWFLLVDPKDPNTELDLHRSVAVKLFMNYSKDPHISKDRDIQSLYNPVKLTAGWLNTLHKMQYKGDEVVMNPNGGLSPLRGWKVLSAVQSDRLAWPTYYADEVIRINQWPDPKAVHFYLKSNKDRLFVPSKFDTLAEASAFAGQFVPASRIIVEKLKLPRSGD